MNGLQIKLLGDVEMSYDGTSILKNLSEKSIAVIAMLVCTEHKKVSRHRLASLLWAESFETANYNLRYNLWNIRKMIPRDQGGQEFVLSDREFCWINPQYEFSCDVIYLEQRKKNLVGEAPADVDLRELLKGSFLDQFYIKNGEEFNEWVEEQRNVYERIFFDLLQQLLARDKENGHLELAIADMVAMLQFDPFNEELNYSLMKAYIKNGNHSRAIAQYKKYKKLLMDELQLEPRECIKKLYASVTRSMEESSENGDDTTVVVLNQRPAPKICYSVAGDLIDCILNQVNDGYLSEISPNYWADIYTIHPDVDRFAKEGRKKQDVNDIRLFYSIRGMLLKLNEDLKFQVIVKNIEKVDEKSKELFGFLSNTTELNLHYEK